MPEVRPRIMLFSPVSGGKRCNTNIHIVYACKKMNKQIQDYCRKGGAVRSLAFFTRWWVPQVPANISECQAALHVPAPACGDCRQQKLPFLSFLCSAHRRLFNLPKEQEVISALWLCCAGHPGQSLLVTSLFAELYMRKEGKRCCEMTVIVYWRPELAEPFLFPCIYSHLSFQ